MNKLDDGMVRQGDVLLVRRSSKASADGEQKRDADGSLTLAHGEVTGHRHRFVCGEVELYEAPKAKTRHLSVVKPSALLHEEHSPPTVALGTYDLPRQVEWNDDLEPRVVAD